MPDVIYNVTYQDFAGVKRAAQIRVCNDSRDLYYATDLGCMLVQPEGHKVLGCGKDAGDPVQAIRTLVGDHGRLIDFKKV